VALSLYNELAEYVPNARKTSFILESKGNFVWQSILKAVLYVPSFEPRTKRSRQILPKSISLKDVVLISQEGPFLPRRLFASRTRYVG
jgi:homoserine kinase